MENYKDTPNEDLLAIRAQIHEISKYENSILVALPKFDAYYLKLQWSIDCAFFLSSSLNIKVITFFYFCHKFIQKRIQLYLFIFRLKLLLNFTFDFKDW